MNYLNGNDRTYDLISCKKMIEDFNKISKIKKFYGEMGHPDNSNKGKKLNKITHYVKNMWIDGNIMKAEIKILNTKVGKIVQKNVDGFVFSPCSIGTVDYPSKIIKLDQLISINVCHFEDDSFYDIRVRRRKLERILKDEN